MRIMDFAWRGRWQSENTKRTAWSKEGPQLHILAALSAAVSQI